MTLDIIETARSAISSVFGNKMRSVLTMLGIIIGIASVIMITSIGNGFQAAISGAFNEMGLNGIQIYADRNAGLISSDMLTMEDAAIAALHAEVTDVTPLWQTRGTASLKNPLESKNFYLIATTEAYKNIQPMNISYGRFLADTDVERVTKVAVIDEGLAVSVFGRKDAVGGKMNVTFWFGTVTYTVIGIIKLDGLNSLFASTPVVYVPITQALDMYNSKNIDSLYVTVNDTDRINQTAKEINRLLEIYHKNKGKYRIENVMQQMEIINKIFASVTAFVGFVAAISLIVGGIGVMNIMLVTVTERTREIGIRKALGATDFNISFQFLTEAMIMTAAGGIIGIAAGYAGGVAVGGMINLQPNLSIPMVITAVLLSSLIGIIFGVYPARKAAKLDPIDALRYD